METNQPNVYGKRKLVTTIGKFASTSLVMSLPLYPGTFLVREGTKIAIKIPVTTNLTHQHC